MPIGIIVDCLSVAFGGIFGALIKNHLREGFIGNLNMVLGLASLGMGIASIVLMQNMPAVIFALIIGTAVGLCIHLGDGINNIVGSLQKRIASDPKTDPALMITAIVLFCASGTGIYGSLVSGMNGDHSILIAKAILDFFTAMIFACTLGKSVALIAVPQFLIFMLLYVLAGVIVPYITPVMINDFKACGGFIMLATGFRMLKLKMFPIADMIPSMVLVMPFSLLWSQYIMSIIG